MNIPLLVKGNSLKFLGHAFLLSVHFFVIGQGMSLLFLLYKEQASYCSSLLLALFI